MTKPYVASAKTAAQRALQLASLIESCAEIQWRPSLNPAARFDTSERALGGIKDPTAETALDERRLALRDAITSAESALSSAAEALLARHADLERAIARWNG